jgi:gluconolactonase
MTPMVDCLELGSLGLLAEGLDHPEGVAMAPDGSLYAGGEAGQIYRIDPDAGGVQQIANTGGIVLGLCLDSAGRVYACDAGRREVLRVTPHGSVEVYCARAGGAPLRVPNWPVFDATGTLWVSDSGSHDRAFPDGTVVRIPPGGGEGEPLQLPPFRFSNGLALGHDGALFVVESLLPGVSVVRGGLVETYVSLPETVPDGLAFDASGALLISCYQPNLILRVPPGGGQPHVVLEDWSGLVLGTPTNIAFFGANLSRLAIASLGGRTIKAIETPWRGQPLHYPTVP